ncbi:hypothetical protein BJ912DRAFT_961714 [Pholiota molesta]|nr:hypothetical protein BJ912DRAFT_961714 [Pholiota molesta]
MGLVHSFYTESFPPKSKFLTQNIPDLSGKVIIVTGGNAGIGKETAKALLARNAKVYIAARNPDKVDKTIKELAKETGKEALFLKVDLSDLKSIKTLWKNLAPRRRSDFLDNTMKNLTFRSGVMVPPIDQLTAQGYDLQFGTNVLGHFYFTKLLMPVLLAGAKSSPDGKARVVNNSSSLYLLANKIDFNTLGDTAARKKKGQEMLYCQSKLGNIVIANEFARRYGDQGILQRHLGGVQYFFWYNGSCCSEYGPLGTPYGALTQLWAGTSPEGADLNGKYLIPWARVSAANKVAKDPKLAGDLWKWLEEQTEKI